MLHSAYIITDGHGGEKLRVVEIPKQLGNEIKVCIDDTEMELSNQEALDLIEAIKLILRIS